VTSCTRPVRAPRSRRRKTDPNASASVMCGVGRHTKGAEPRRLRNDREGHGGAFRAAAGRLIYLAMRYPATLIAARMKETMVQCAAAPPRCTPSHRSGDHSASRDLDDVCRGNRRLFWLRNDRHDRVYGFELGNDRIVASDQLPAAPFVPPFQPLTGSPASANRFRFFHVRMPCRIQAAARAWSRPSDQRPLAMIRRSRFA
jgi:hypothetical protein